jgi:hypothetical protein
MAKPKNVTDPQICGKDVEMEKKVNPSQPSQEKPQHTVEELEKYIQQIHVEYNKLAEANRQMNNNNAVIRVELLFKVLDKANFFPKPFVKKCVLELEDLLTIPDQEEKK